MNRATGQPMADTMYVQWPALASTPYRMERF
jgi:hypothetical protein